MAEKLPAVPVAGASRFRGVIRYRARGAGGSRERGRESFTICRLSDGSRLFNAHCEIDDSPKVLRDVSIVFDPLRRPVTASVTVAVDGELKGSGWYLFGATRVEFEGWSAEAGRQAESVAVLERIRAFGTHPLQADALLMALAGAAGDGSPAVLEEYFVCSNDHRGASSPQLLRYPTGLRVWFVGAERISVEAGQFDSWHFRLSDHAHAEPQDEGSRNEPGKHPPYDLWVSADGEYILLRAELGGYAQRIYELSRLERD